MGSKKYTLEPLVDVRRDKADAAKRELGDAIRARETKEAELQAVRLRTLAHAGEVARTKDAERAALDQGALRAVDLLRQDAWQLHQERAAEELAHRERQSADAARGALADEDRARADTAEKLGELKVVERDRERFLEREKKVALAMEEEAAEEAWRPRS